MVPLAEVFKTPTIRKLAEYLMNIEQNIDLPYDRHLVLLKRAPGKAGHVFFIHDGSGEVEGYVDFCRLLDIPMNCWGIKADDTPVYAPRDMTIEEIAAQYIKKVKTLQPQGPYFIAGWSIGGTITFEMAKQLEQDNQKIQFLALIDTIAPDRTLWEDGTAKQFTLGSELQWLNRYLGDGKDIQLKQKLSKASSMEQMWNHLVEYLLSRSNPLDLQAIKKLIPAGLSEIIPNFAGLGIQELVFHLNRTRTLDQARNRYIPAGIVNTPVHFFAAMESEVSVQHGWYDYFKEPLKLHKLNGDHFSILRKPAVIRFAEAFAFLLNSQRY